jgi:hypothetical protein
MSHTDTRARRPQNQPLAVRPLVAEVRSETDPNKAYTVVLPQCHDAQGNPCKDFYYRRGTLADPFCKHLRAAMGLVPEGGQRLDEDTAVELLIALRVRPSAAMAGLRRARNGASGTITAPDGMISVMYHPNAEVYDLILHLS